MRFQLVFHLEPLFRKQAEQVLLGSVAAEKLPVRVVHGVAAVIFALLGIALLTGFDLGL